MRRVSREQWELEQRSLYAGWDKYARGLDKLHGPPRKLRLLADENLEAELVSFVDSIEGFRSIRLQAGLDDRALWNEARRRGHAILSADIDFWNDRLYPLRDCPGLIIVAGSTGKDRATAFLSAAVRWDLVRKHRAIPDFMHGLKIMARPNGTSGKFWSVDGDMVIVG